MKLMNESKYRPDGLLYAPGERLQSWARYLYLGYYIGVSGHHRPLRVEPINEGRNAKKRAKRAAAKELRALANRRKAK